MIIHIHQPTNNKTLIATLILFQNFDAAAASYTKQKLTKEIANILEVNSHKMRIKLHSQPPIAQSDQHMY